MKIKHCHLLIRFKWKWLNHEIVHVWMVTAKPQIKGEMFWDINSTSNKTADFCLNFLFSAVYTGSIFMPAMCSALSRKRPFTQCGVYVLYIRTAQLQQNVARKQWLIFLILLCIACVRYILSKQSQMLGGSGSY